jgi:hypothetical protein
VALAVCCAAFASTSEDRFAVDFKAFEQQRAADSPLGERPAQESVLFP